MRDLLEQCWREARDRSRGPVSMWEQRERFAAMLGELSLRNLVVLMARYGENVKAQQLLALG